MDSARLESDRRVLLAAILLLAFISRLAGIGAPLTGDEGYTWLVSSAPTASEFLERLANFENTPPLYYLLAAPLGDGEAALRVPSLLAGTASVGVVYAIVRPLLGTPAALLSALALAALPEQAAHAAGARGFLLCEFALLVALWAAVRLVQGGRRRWWWLWTAGATAALYSEYDAGLFLGVVLVGLLVIGRPARRETLVFGVLPPALLFAPWTGEVLRSLDQVGETKPSPVAPDPTPGAWGDVIVPEFLGRYGRDASETVRTVELAALAAAFVAAWLLLWRRAAAVRAPLALVVSAGLGTLVLHAAIHGLGGPDLFTARYLVVIAPIGVVLVAGAVALLAEARRWSLPVAAIALLAIGTASAVRRLDSDSARDPDRYRAFLADEGVQTAITNNAAVIRYLPDQRVVFAATGITPEFVQACARTARLPLAVLEDSDIGEEHIVPPGESAQFGSIAVAVVRMQPPVSASVPCTSVGL